MIRSFSSLSSASAASYSNGKDIENLLDSDYDRELEDVDVIEDEEISDEELIKICKEIETGEVIYE